MSNLRGLIVLLQLVTVSVQALYIELSGLRTNLYKNFILQSWGLLTDEGISGLLHPYGVFEDPKGGTFRKSYYTRLKAHYQLKNELQLFHDVDHHMVFWATNLKRDIFRHFGSIAIPKSSKI